MTTESVPRDSLEQKLRAVLRGTAATTGDAFFQALTRHLADALGVTFAFVAECTDETKTRVHTLAYWGGDRYLPDLEYAVAGTPCERVMQNEVVFYRDNVPARFPGSIRVSQRYFGAFRGFS